MAVILLHAAHHIDKAFGAPGLATLFQAGHAGVDLFFVLSGFIILFVHRRDVGRADRLGHCVRRRISRVLPLHWIALLFQSVFIGAAWQAWLGAGLASDAACFVVLAAAAMLGGTLVARQVERPLLAAMRGRRGAPSLQ